MKKLLEFLGLQDNPNTISTDERHNRDFQFSDVDMESFAKWCEELNVSSLARNPEFTITIGNHVKYVTLDRF